MSIHHSILIVEAFHHPKVVEFEYLMLQNQFKVECLLIPDKRNSYDKLMPTVLKECNHRFSFHSTTLFIELLFLGWKYDYIHISTGPESDHWSSYWTVPFFGICSIIYQKKIILTIKNIRPYLYSSKGIFSKLRFLIIKKIKKFLFETQTMKRTFEKEINHKFKTGIIYDRYVDLLKINTKILNNKDSGTIRLGVLGGINTFRRDYDLMINAFKELTIEERNRFKLLILGQCPLGDNNPVIISLKSLLKVECQEGIISAEDFDNIGISCDLFISPLSRNKEYGSYNGTGALGDAVYLKKLIIIPKFVDPELEFSEIALYYESSKDLAEQLRSIKNLTSRKVNATFYDKFSSKNIIKGIIRDLNLVIM